MEESSEQAGEIPVCENDLGRTYFWSLLPSSGFGGSVPVLPPFHSGWSNLNGPWRDNVIFFEQAMKRRQVRAKRGSENRTQLTITSRVQQAFGLSASCQLN
jgi:hypothetical protein